MLYNTTISDLAEMAGIEKLDLWRFLEKHGDDIETAAMCAAEDVATKYLQEVENNRAAVIEDGQNAGWAKTAQASSLDR